MSPPPPPPPPPQTFTSSLLLFLLFLSISPPTFFSSPLSTIAISHVFNQTLVCALVPSSISVDSQYILNCTSLPSRTHLSYPSGSAKFSAIAAGDGFLCALASLPSSSSNVATMKWWDFSHSNGTIPDAKRVYRGTPLEALTAGDSHVCALVGGTHKPNCWRWPELSIPFGLNFSEIAAGRDFVCGLLDSGVIECFGDESEVVRKQPAGNFTAIAAGSRHACAIADDGRLVCWGVGAPKVERIPFEISSLALGENRTCALSTNGTILCWGVNFTLPEDLAGEQFMAIQARGGAFCGILMVNYSLICWGNEVFRRNPVVFETVLPGTCAPIPSCSCGILPGSGNICTNGGICQPCKLVVRKPDPPASPPVSTVHPQTGGGGGGKKRRLLFVILGSVGLGVGLATMSCFLLFQLCKGRRSRVYDSGRLDDTRPPLGIPSTRAPPHTDPESTPAMPIDIRLSALFNKGHSSIIEEFPLQILVLVTNNFSEDHKIGSGSFGSVYRATLDDGREAAIKRAEVTASSSRPDNKRRDREDAFLSELSLLSRVNHKNLVRLLGYCKEGTERVLVYEFISRGTLHDHLHKLPNSPLRSWDARIKVALDAARGIEYLHTYAVPPIIHRDIKPSNILLDDAWTAKVSDFGLSLMTPEDDDTSQKPSRAAGTVGYMDPEYYRLRRLTDKSDVYSFGVVLLEMLSGCKAIHRHEESGSPRNVVDFAVPHIVSDRIHQVLDPKLPLPTPSEMEAVMYVGYLAADCVSPEGRDRPTMTEIVSGLERALAACLDPSLSRSTTTRSI